MSGYSSAPDASGEDMNTDRRPLLFITAGIFTFVSLFSVLLRFIARRTARLSLYWDDWLIAASLPFAWSLGIINIYGGVRYGEGRHIQYSTKDDLRSLLKSTYVFVVFYIVALGLAKLSLIALYFRMSTAKGFRKLLIVTAAITGAWMVSCTIAQIFSCTPIAGVWDVDASQNKRCFDERTFFIGYATPNIAIDIILLALPIYKIIYLKGITFFERVAICGMFGLGIFVTASPAIRLQKLIALVDKPQSDMPFDITDSAVWSVVEANLSILCACMPCARTLFQHANKRHRANSISTFMTRQTSSAHGVADPYAGQSRKVPPLPTHTTSTRVQSGAFRGQASDVFGEESEVGSVEELKFADRKPVRLSRLSGIIQVGANIMVLDEGDNLEDERTGKGKGNDREVDTVFGNDETFLVIGDRPSEDGTISIVDTMKKQW